MSFAMQMWFQASLAFPLRSSASVLGWSDASLTPRHVPNTLPTSQLLSSRKRNRGTQWRSKANSDNIHCFAPIWNEIPKVSFHFSGVNSWWTLNIAMYSAFAQRAFRKVNVDELTYWFPQNQHRPLRAFFYFQECKWKKSEKKVCKHGNMK